MKLNLANARTLRLHGAEYAAGEIEVAITVTGCPEQALPLGRLTQGLVHGHFVDVNEMVTPGPAPGSAAEPEDLPPYDDATEPTDTE